MTLPNGYEMTTTFWDDFSIADAFGELAVRDTYKRAMADWKNNYVYLTELVVVLNMKIWQHYQRDRHLGEVYNELWEKADEYACDHLTGDEATFFFEVTD